MFSSQLDLMDNTTCQLYMSNNNIKFYTIDVEAFSANTPLGMKISYNNLKRHIIIIFQNYSSPPAVWQAVRTLQSTRLMLSGCSYFTSLVASTSIWTMSSSMISRTTATLSLEINRKKGWQWLKPKHFVFLGKHSTEAWSQSLTMPYPSPSTTPCPWWPWTTSSSPTTPPAGTALDQNSSQVVSENLQELNKLKIFQNLLR